MFLASSYRQYKTDNKNKFGDSIEIAKPTDKKNVFVACLEIRCPGDVYKKDKDPNPEWIHVLVTHLTGNCDLQNNSFPQQLNIDNKGTTCPSRSKRHAAGSENWFCVPLPAGIGFDIDRVYTTDTFDDKKVRKKGVNRCNLGRNNWMSGNADPNEDTPTIEFSCR